MYGPSANRTPNRHATGGGIRIDGPDLLCERVYWDSLTLFIQFGVAREPNTPAGKLATLLNPRDADSGDNSMPTKSLVAECNSHALTGDDQGYVMRLNRFIAGCGTSA
jgi:hypothetical protein